jgi:hypothetical protein
MGYHAVLTPRHHSCLVDGASQLMEQGHLRYFKHKGDPECAGEIELEDATWQWAGDREFIIQVRTRMRTRMHTRICTRARAHTHTVTHTAHTQHTVTQLCTQSLGHTHNVQHTRTTHTHDTHTHNSHELTHTRARTHTRRAPTHFHLRALTTAPRPFLDSSTDKWRGGHVSAAMLTRARGACQIAACDKKGREHRKYQLRAFSEQEAKMWCAPLAPRPPHTACSTPHPRGRRVRSVARRAAVRRHATHGAIVVMLATRPHAHKHAECNMRATGLRVPLP